MGRTAPARASQRQPGLLHGSGISPRQALLVPQCHGHGLTDPGVSRPRQHKSPAALPARMAWNLGPRDRATATGRHSGEVGAKGHASAQRGDSRLTVGAGEPGQRDREQEQRGEQRQRHGCDHPHGHPVEAKAAEATETAEGGRPSSLALQHQGGSVKVVPRVETSSRSRRPTLTVTVAVVVQPRSPVTSTTVCTPPSALDGDRGFTWSRGWPAGAAGPSAGPWSGGRSLPLSAASCGHGS